MRDSTGDALGVALLADTPFVHVLLLSRLDVTAFRIQHTARVTGNDVSGFHSGKRQQAKRSDIRGACTHQGNAYLLHIFSDNLQRIDETGEQHSGRALLIVVPHRNGEFFSQPVENTEALGLRDVFQIDATKVRLDELDRPNDFIRVLGVQAHRHRIDAAQVLEQQCLAFHDGQSRLRSDIAEAEHACTVGDNGDGIALVGVLVNELWILANGATRRRYSRRVPSREVFETADSAFGHHLHLSPVVRVQAHGLPRWLAGFCEQALSVLISQRFTRGSVHISII